MGELFVATVSRNRKVPAEQVRAMQAVTYLGAAGVSQGLADGVMAPDAAFRALLAEINK
jgi:ClpP class serine protease